MYGTVISISDGPKKSSDYFFKLLCVRSIAKEGQWEGVEARGGVRLSPGIFPNPPHAVLPTHISLHTHKKLLDFGWPVTYGHHCASKFCKPTLTHGIQRQHLTPLTSEVLRLTTSGAIAVRGTKQHNLENTVFLFFFFSILCMESSSLKKKLWIMVEDKVENFYV